MKQLSEILKLAEQHLEKCRVNRPRLSAEELLAHVLDLKRIDLYMQFDRPLNEKEITHFRNLIQRRVKHEPIQYILGEVPFFNCSLKIGPEVLIPRHETEILLDKITTQLKGEAAGKVVWDICTGSGALAIGLKKALPELEMSASDLSESALQVARENSRKNGVAVSFYQGDFLTPFQNKKADIVVCNPPYISEKEYLNLEQEVRHYEPRLALVGGNTGLEFYERLAAELPSYLNSQAKVFLEVGAGQGSALKHIFNNNFWKVARLEQDWAGHDRFFFLECE